MKYPKSSTFSYFLALILYIVIINSYNREVSGRCANIPARGDDRISITSESNKGLEGKEPFARVL